MSLAPPGRYLSVVSSSRRRRIASALLALAIGVLIVLLATNWSSSLLRSLGAVGLVLALVIVLAIVYAIFAWHGDFF